MLNKPAYLIVILCVAVSITGMQSCGESTEQRSEGLPGIPDNLRSELIKTCDYVDIIFYNSPASMNQSDQGSIRRALDFISPQAASLSETCQPLGRISYMSDGEITAEGDIYLSNACRYIVFMEENQPVYANTMSPAGVQFFQQVLQGIQNQTSPQ